MPRRCELGCEPSGVPLHAFPDPVKHPERFKAWVTIVGGKLERSYDYEDYKKRKLCDIHFTNKDRNRNHRLNALAVPSVHLPNESLYSFPDPVKNPEKHRAWMLIAFGNENYSELDYKKYRVCGKHFTDADRTCSRRLNDLAVPSLSLPGIPLHRFPDPNTNHDRFIKWVSSIGGLHLQDKKYVYNKLRVCRKHFRTVYLYPSRQLCKLAIPELQLSGSKRHQPDSDDPSGKVLLDHNYGKLPTEHEPPSADEIGIVPQKNPENHKICVQTQGENTKLSHGNKNNPLPPVSENSDTELPDCDYSVVGEDDSVPLGEDGCAESQIYVKTQSYDLTSAYEKDPLSLKPEPDDDDPFDEDQLCDNNRATLPLLQTNPVISQKVQNNNVSTQPPIEVSLPTTKPSVQEELDAANKNILNLVQQNRIKDDIIKELRISLAQKESKIQTLQHQVKAMELHISIIAPKLKTFEKTKQNFESKEYKRLQKRNLLLKSKLTNKAIFDKLTKDFNTTARTFFEMQCLLNKKKDRGRRYTLQGKILGLSLYKASPTVYKLLCKYFILPSVKSLKQFILQLKRQMTSRNCTVPANDTELNSEPCRAEPDNSEDSPNKETINTNNSHAEAFQPENSIFIDRLTPQNNEPITMQIIGPTALQLHDGLTVPIDEGQTIELVEGIAVELGNGRLVMLSEGQLVECGDNEMPDDDYDGQMEVDDWQNNQDDNLTRNNCASVHSAEMRKETEIKPRITFEDSEELIETHIIKKLKESHPPEMIRAQDMPDLT